MASLARASSEPRRRLLVRAPEGSVLRRDAPAVNDRFVELPGRGIAWVVDRPGPRRRSPTVLLLHGWRATATANWRSCLEPLSRHHRVVAIDHRGHGQGIRSDERFSLEACADDAASLLDVLGLREAIVVGYSMGGPIAQLLWRRHRERVAGLVFCATAADMRVAHPTVVAAVQDLEGALGVVPKSLRMAGMRAVAGRVAVDEEHRELLVDGFATHDERVVRQAGWAVGRFRSTAWIGDVDVPTEVVVTARDHVVLPARQLELARRVPGARATMVEAGHLACSNDPEVFATAVDGAVRRAADRRRPRWWRRARHLFGARAPARPATSSPS